MLIVKGFRCRFFLEGGSSRSGNVLLHDESGDDWPYTSGLIVPGFQRLGEPCDDKQAQRYYGADYDLRCGRVELPPRDLEDGWEEIGRVVRVHYDRRGEVEPGPYEHEFGEGGLFRIVMGGGFPRLYRRESAMRIELGRGAVWDWRGIH